MNKAGKRLLCIEDDLETMGLIVEDLVDRGYEVISAYDGQQGIDALLEHHPDLVLCDINIPVMSGFEVLSKLTAIAPSFADVPFIFLTALSDRDNELHGRRLGADDYVTKPIDFERLAMIIDKRLDSVARAQPVPSAVRLNEREIETLSWSARGKTSDEIAQIVGLTKTAIDAQLNSARMKLGATSRTEAVVKAVQGGLIKP